VLVLDDAPAELVRLVGYLEGIAQQLTIDLVTVSRYQMGDVEAIVPQRVDPGREAVEPMPLSAGSIAGKAYYVQDGGADYGKAIESLPKDDQARALRLLEFAKSLEAEGLATLWGYHGPRYMTLLPHPPNHDAGLVTLVLDSRSSANHLPRVEQANSQQTSCSPLSGRPTGKPPASDPRPQAKSVARSGLWVG
jgi:hypothetical protein